MDPGEWAPVSIGPVTDWYYVETGMYDVTGFGCVYLFDGERPAMVDTGIGTNSEAILSAMGEVGIDPADLSLIAPTHVHLDHAGGAGYLAEACPNATVAVHERGARHLIDPSRLVAGTEQAVGDQWQYYADPRPVPEDRVREITGGDVLDLGDRDLRVHDAPGHAPHQAVFESPADRAVFTADAAGIYLPGPATMYHTSPPPTFDLEQCLADVAMLQRLDPAVCCYTHFGPARAADRLGEYANALTAWVERVAEERARHSDDAAVGDAIEPGADAVAAWGERKAHAEERMNVRGVLRYLDERQDETD
jgi:glyoxylase-like metal-dependent hydrolase (beta-lactamase superfamily II)